MAILDPRTGALFSDFAMDVASAISNRKRNQTFKGYKKPPYQGPVIVAEGDSWFCYPVELVSSAPQDVIVQLGREFAIRTGAKPGDLASQMRDFLHEAGGLLEQVEAYQPDLVLLSAGGNDLLGKGKLQGMLKDGDRLVPDYFKTSAFRDTFWGVIADIEAIIRDVAAHKSDVKIIMHGYDYALPSGKGGWLRTPMETLGIPPAKWQNIIDQIVDWFNRALAQLIQTLNEDLGGEKRVFHVNLRGAVLAAQWYDELHPSTTGFKSVAARFRRTILEAYPLIS
jgi:metacaspase-1